MVLEDRRSWTSKCWKVGSKLVDRARMPGPHQANHTVEPQPVGGTDWGQLC